MPTQEELDIIGYINGYVALIEYKCALERGKFPEHFKTKERLRKSIDSLALDIPEEIGNYLRYRPWQLRENLIKLMESLKEE